jgi:competence protein ComEC
MGRSVLFLGNRRRRHAWRPASWWVTLALGAFFLAGALHIQLRGPTDAPDPSLQPFNGQEVEMTAHVTTEGKFREGAANEIRQSLDVETEAIVAENGRPIPVHSGVRLGIYKTLPEATPRSLFHYGERLQLPVKLKLPRNFRNPGPSTIRDTSPRTASHPWARRKRKTCNCSPALPAAASNSGDPAFTQASSPKCTPSGPRRRLPSSTQWSSVKKPSSTATPELISSASGTYHILVVSGMNVTILAFVAFWTLRRLRLAEVPATLLTILSCVAYAFLTEAGALVWRAMLMCAIYLSTRLLYRDRAMVNALGAAALGLLVFDPRQLFTASIQMTCLCVLIVAAIGVPLIERTSRLYRQALAHWDADDFGPSLPPRVAQFRLDLRLLARQLARFVGTKWSLRLVRTVTVICLGAAASSSAAPLRDREGHDFR